jgi:hypothetical protein
MISHREHPISFSELETFMLQEDSLWNREVETEEEAMFVSHFSNRGDGIS